jgi:hypothetical protein
MTVKQQLMIHLTTAHGEHAHVNGTHQQLALRHQADHGHKHLTH